MPNKKLIKKTQKLFNSFIRNRDGKICISCGKYDENIQAGHYRPIGSASHLRFNQDNCHSQCSECNCFKSGNVKEYREKLIRKIGIERILILENDNKPLRFTDDILNDLCNKYNSML